MSNVALFNPAQAPAFAKNRGELSALAKSLAGGARRQQLRQTHLN
jgi:hypothetical protein